MQSSTMRVGPTAKSIETVAALTAKYFSVPRWTTIIKFMQRERTSD